jgi:hypothetical membrane protein
MHALRHIDVGIRSQAVLIFALAALWCASFFGWFSEMDSSHYSWTAIFFFMPFIMLLFGAILWVSYRRAGGAHKRWFIAALVVTICPWIVFLLLLADAGFI